MDPANAAVRMKVEKTVTNPVTGSVFFIIATYPMGLRKMTACGLFSPNMACEVP
jgi:hypothetical protein